MGIDFSHCDAHWAYSGFNRFRTKIANAAGLMGDLGDHFDKGTYVKILKSPVYPLINHSDCDGELTVEEMKSIVPTLKSIIDNWPDDDRDKQEGMELIKGMELAIEDNEVLEFQ